VSCTFPPSWAPRPARIIPASVLCVPPPPAPVLRAAPQSTRAAPQSSRAAPQSSRAAPQSSRPPPVLPGRPPVLPGPPRSPPGPPRSPPGPRRGDCRLPRCLPPPGLRATRQAQARPLAPAVRTPHTGTACGPTARAKPPPRAPRILVKTGSAALLARAHGAILKICYKIVNKLREHGHDFPCSVRHLHPATLLSYPCRS